MEMKKLTGGNLRAVGYDDRRRSLVVELTSGTFEYGGVSAETCRHDAVGVVAVELLPRQHRRGVSGEARALNLRDRHRSGSDPPRVARTR